MKILVTGASGFVGSALVPVLQFDGHVVSELTRYAKPGRRSIEWDPQAGRLDPDVLEGFDAVIHLAGESIAAGRWNADKKRGIRDSRVMGTRLLSSTIKRLKNPPPLFISASAIGYYGDRGAEILNEKSEPGSDFLAGVCEEWEAAAQAASSDKTRVINTRFGVILGKGGGALSKMLTPFKLGVGGKVGSGQQIMSWVSLEDVVGVLKFLLKLGGVTGPVNVVAPRPVSNAEFTKELGRTLSEPTVLSMPAFVARLAMGEMADALLLSSQRVEPSELKRMGYSFKHPDLAGALKKILS